ncbi:hypothetical protein [Natronogracilivirga saccharolytica]|uniref:Uncharacterized protein n=1 Tax=Natronogracilivirga saccharolytica TaxID=2812953 RepID=A0A8J7RPX5_9BACT|nr:hypothetical protein [Natronogracilivirga saccharolytica]MBP3193998.1 hypothetical protein [Natronogracilivirga saccharolytica]
MEEIVLIEDRPERMAHLCNKKGLNLEEFEQLRIFTKKEIESLEKNLESNNFKMLDGYKIVMTHQSAWSQVKLSSLKDFCKRTNKPLVIFSGNGSPSHFHLTDPPILTIEVDKFYSPRLTLFIEHFLKNGIPNLLLLQYGNKWKLNLLMEARNNLSVFLSKNKGIKTLNYYNDAVGIPQALFSMSEELSLNLEWYEDGIAENADNVLIDLKNQLSKVIKREVFSL